MLRVFLLLLITASLSARASDPIAAPAGGVSATVSQPHVTAALIPEMTSVQAGQPFDVALHLKSDPGWHTYWINPGDAGMATTIKWELPPGFTAGPIQWPTPEKHDMGGLMTFGYAGDVYLLTTITPPKDNLPQHFDIKAKASWLVCKEECIPGKAELTLSLDSGLMNLRLPVDNKDLFEQARERLPVENTRWDIKAVYHTTDSVAMIMLEEKSTKETFPGHLVFFPEQSNVLSALSKDTTQSAVSSSDIRKAFQKVFPFTGKTSASGAPDRNALALLVIKLQQNGQTPDKLSGVVVSDQPLIGNARAVYLSEFPVSDTTANQPNSGVTPPSGDPGNSLPGSPQATASEPTAAQRAAATTETPPLLIAVLGAAFVGGLILNLMPCVLPVLSLKVFSLMKHAGQNPKTAWIQGAAFTAGVVISFWVLAGLLLALRAAGNHLGWGFQMQSPGFVLGLIFLFFLLALNLFGVFELGASLVGLDAKAAGNLSGVASSFGNGALATLAATPCTAPFMGSALGFAAQQPAIISLLIFTFLALGMATPYLLLTIFPGALRFVPKPGAWMEAFKQFMGFLLMATVIFLVYVFGALTAQEVVPMLLLALLLAGVAAWIYGKWTPPIYGATTRAVATLLSFLILAGAIAFGVTLTNPKLRGLADARENTEGWQPWTPAAVDAALAKGNPVFVDFTAAWCLSCKVNERVALGTDEVKKAFADHKVTLFRADWTHSDPAISKTLQDFHRDGVPLYLLYSPQKKDTPQVLPEVLTPGIVLDALKAL